MFRELHADLGDLEVRERTWAWHMWPHGVINTYRSKTRYPVKEGNVLRQAVTACCRVLGQSRCTYKVGIARGVRTRWEFYQNPDDPHTWIPTHMFVVAAVQGRKAASYLEAGIIAVLETLYEEKELFINLLRKDYGGGGAQWKATEDSTYFVYLAVRAIA